MALIQYFGNTGSIKQISRSKFKTTLLSLAKNHQKVIDSISYIFVSDPEILEINKKHLNHDYYTDIITFDLTDTDQSVEAEIYISIDTVSTNANLFQTEFQTEILRVMYHGVLHLLGYADKSTNEKKQMRAMEDHCLNLYLETNKQ